MTIVTIAGTGGPMGERWGLNKITYGGLRHRELLKGIAYGLLHRELQKGITYGLLHREHLKEAAEKS